MASGLNLAFLFLLCRISASEVKIKEETSNISTEYRNPVTIPETVISTTPQLVTEIRQTDTQVNKSVITQTEPQNTEKNFDIDQKLPDRSPKKTLPEPLKIDKLREDLDAIVQ